MKRRNIDSAKFRRTLKKNKANSNLCGDTLIYIKLLALWSFIILADFLLGVRFEYLWTFWLLLRNVYDSFRHEGLIFSVFFICITVASDMICFLFVPVQWLFFLASTYFWVQYVWQADRGICVSTAALWLLFVYIEASVRLKELKSVPFTLDLCRPFAANCIGYPAVTLGFGVKSFVSYKLRLRRQREVARMNGLHRRMLSEALPIDCRSHDDDKALSTGEDVISNGTMCSTKEIISNGNAGQTTTVNADKARSPRTTNLAASSIPKKLSREKVVCDQSSNGICDHQCGPDSPDDITAADGSESKVVSDEYSEMDSSSTLSILNAVKSKLFGSTTSTQTTSNYSQNSQNIWTMYDSDEESRASRDSRDSQAVSAGGGIGKRNTMGNGKPKSKRRIMNSIAAAMQEKSQEKDMLLEDKLVKDRNTPQSLLEPKEKVQDKFIYVNLESDIDKLKSDLRTSRAREQELRNQIQQLTTADKTAKSELQQLRQNNEQLQTRIQNLVRSRQQDKQNMTVMEKKLAEEQKLRAQSEQQLQQERKQKKATDASRSSSNVSKADCPPACKQRQVELESQLKQLQRDLEQREKQTTQLENELRTLRDFKEQSKVEILMSALSAVQEKNAYLETALSSETRIKLDLFSALGDAKRQLEILQGKLTRAEREAEDMRRRLTGRVSSSTYLHDGITSPLTPLSAAAMDGATLDFLGPAAYQMASCISALPGIMFNEGATGLNDNGTLQQAFAGHVAASDSTASSARAGSR